MLLRSVGQVHLHQFLPDVFVADGFFGVQEQAVHVLDWSASLTVVADHS